MTVRNEEEEESVMPRKFLPRVGAAFIEEETGVTMGIQRRHGEFHWSGSRTQWSGVESWGLGSRSKFGTRKSTHG